VDPTTLLFWEKTKLIYQERHLACQHRLLHHPHRVGCDFHLHLLQQQLPSVADWKRGGLLGPDAERVMTLLSVALAHVRFWRGGKEAYPAAMHFLILWGTILVFLGKGIRLFSLLTGLTVPTQSVYLFASSLSEIGGVIIIIGRPWLSGGDSSSSPTDSIRNPMTTLNTSGSFLILLTGFLIKGTADACGRESSPGCFSWAPFSATVSRFMLILPSEQLNELLVWHRVLIHAIPALAFFGYIVVSRSSLEHIYLSASTSFIGP